MAKSWQSRIPIAFLGLTVCAGWILGKVVGQSPGNSAAQSQYSTSDEGSSDGLLPLDSFELAVSDLPRPDWNALQRQRLDLSAYQPPWIESGLLEFAPLEWRVTSTRPLNTAYDKMVLRPFDRSPAEASSIRQESLRVSTRTITPELVVNQTPIGNPDRLGLVAETHVGRNEQGRAPGRIISLTGTMVSDRDGDAAVAQAAYANHDSKTVRGVPKQTERRKPTERAEHGASVVATRPRQAAATSRLAKVADDETSALPVIASGARANRARVEFVEPVDLSDTKASVAWIETLPPIQNGPPEPKQERRESNPEPRELSQERRESERRQAVAAKSTVVDAVNGEKNTAGVQLPRIVNGRVVKPEPSVGGLTGHREGIKSVPDDRSEQPAAVRVAVVDTPPSTIATPERGESSNQVVDSSLVLGTTAGGVVQGSSKPVDPRAAVVTHLPPVVAATPPVRHQSTGRQEPIVRAATAVNEPASDSAVSSKGARPPGKPRLAGIPDSPTSTGARESIDLAPTADAPADDVPADDVLVQRPVALPSVANDPKTTGAPRPKATPAKVADSRAAKGAETLGEEVAEASRAEVTETASRSEVATTDDPTAEDRKGHAVTAPSQAIAVAEPSIAVAAPEVGSPNASNRSPSTTAAAPASMAIAAAAPATVTPAVKTPVPESRPETSNTVEATQTGPSANTVAVEVAASPATVPIPKSAALPKPGLKTATESEVADTPAVATSPVATSPVATPPIATPMTDASDQELSPSHHDIVVAGQPQGLATTDAPTGDDPDNASPLVAATHVSPVALQAAKEIDPSESQADPLGLPENGDVTIGLNASAAPQSADSNADASVLSQESGLVDTGIESDVINDRMIPSGVVDSARPMILFQPAVPGHDARGRAVLRPTVRLADHPEEMIMPAPAVGSELVPNLAGPFEEGRITTVSEPVVESVFIREANFRRRLWAAGERAADLWQHRRRRPVSRLYQYLASTLQSQCAHDVGVGRERLPFAMFEMDSSQPLNNFRFRFDSAWDWEFPDRAEYFWSTAPKGPETIEPSVDYQDIRVLMEIGGPRLSVGTEIPLRFLDPTLVGNTVGLGDLSVTTKTLLLDGEKWQLTQVLRTQTPTGTPKVGRGNGHVSMEPGMIARYEWSQDTMIHSELKLWFPLGADPDFGGEVLRYGLGFAHLWYDSDDFAVIPTLEFVSWSILSGRRSQRVFNGLIFQDADFRVDGENIFNIYPGLRIVRDRGGDFGLFEFGVAGGFAVSNRHWYRGLLRMDVRFSF